MCYNVMLNIMMEERIITQGAMFLTWPFKEDTDTKMYKCNL